ncbi:PTS sugar transporter subunit IIC [Enterococcus gallinarum]|uniref:PTS sugar transporter subunit IIC n=1 Tax=Enterococcus gallinarum TaxID=1353 RepID=UPI001AD7D87A|nr:PTS transporter subunit EIIC [Enterococcus gallinarum]MBO6332963.1 PTS sugar transporter subunit IIC [Enterococcus gallinarum]MBO6353595.1 PTS sugar transporter subunit IIC [Enterococcus gallinarum]MBO6395832.1 PTS sugar transporter subunit IIC [Enterococcus gallinarum]MBO6423740.1 PTS sugar transporter subunit IIC [Enterococcus gallinarum]MEB5970250.1 PTS transporter subunit EIIC [Enterococcus gallinarum]
MPKFIDGLTAISEKIAKNSLLQIITGAFMMMLPITMTGGFAGLFNGISYEPYQNFLTSFGIKPVLSVIYQWTSGTIGLYLAFLVAYSFAQKKDISSSKIIVGLISVVCFLIITPYTVPSEPYATSSLPLNWLGASGMFSSIMVAFIVGLIFAFCKKYRLGIKLPDQVPAYIAEQFTALIPVILSTIVFGLISCSFTGTSFGSFHQFIYTVIGTPLNALGSNVWGFWILQIVMYGLWFFGIHGGMTVGPVIMTLFMQLQLENLTAYQAGQPLPHIMIGDALSFGTGSLPLLVAILIFAKSEANRTIGKLSLVPAIFGVDEPAYFGIPMILNPIFFIPWVLIAPTLSVIGTHLLKVVGLLGYSTGAGSQNTASLPFFVGNSMNYGLQGLIWGFVLFVIVTIVYIPFVKAYDKQKFDEENSKNENKVEENETFDSK